MPAQVAAQNSWTVVDADPQHDVTCDGDYGAYSCAELANPYLDISTVEARQDANNVYVRFSHYPADDSVAPFADDHYTADLRLYVADAGLSVHVETGKSPSFNLVGPTENPDEARRPYLGAASVAGSAYEATVTFGKADIAAMLGGVGATDLWVDDLRVSGSDDQMGTASDAAGTYLGGDHLNVDLPDVPAPVPTPLEWKQAVGPAYSMAPSLAVDENDAPHAAFISYVGTPGLYYANLQGGYVTPEFITNVQLPRIDSKTPHPAFNTSTAIAVAEHVYVAFFPKPGQGGGIRIAESGPDGWSVSDPSTLADGKTLKVDDSYRAIPSIAARGGDVVVAVPTREPAGFAVVHRTNSAWSLIEAFEFGGPTFPRVSMDLDGCVHFTAFSEDARDDQLLVTGSVALTTYCTDDGGRFYWSRDMTLARDVTDNSLESRSSAQDGAFDALLDKDGNVFVVYERRDGAHRFGQINGWTADHRGLLLEASKLVLGGRSEAHRMRIAIDQDGTTHMLAGDDVARAYSTRSKDGAWTLHPAPALGLFQVAASSGHPVVAGIDLTNNHSLVLSTDAQNPAAFLSPQTPVDLPTGTPAKTAHSQAPAAKNEPANVPATGAWEDIALFGAFIGLGLGGVAAKRAALRTPRWFFRLFATIGGFSRLNKDKLLEHQVRDLISEAVRFAPGTPASAVRDELDLPKTTFFYHLSRLTHERLVRTQRVPNNLLLYPGDAPVPSAPVMMLNDDAELLSLVRKMPGGTAIDYARRVMQEPRTVRLRFSGSNARASLRLDG